MRSLHLEMAKIRWFDETKSTQRPFVLQERKDETQEQLETYQTPFYKEYGDDLDKIMDGADLILTRKLEEIEAKHKALEDEASEQAAERTEKQRKSPERPK